LNIFPHGTLRDPLRNVSYLKFWKHLWNYAFSVWALITSSIR